MGRSQAGKKMGFGFLGQNCTPKSLGGLGIRDPQNMGQALVAKFLWRWNKKPEALWDIIWKDKYAKDSPLIEWILMEGVVFSLCEISLIWLNFNFLEEI
jgi:hypothetical protein